MEETKGAVHVSAHSPTAKRKREAEGSEPAEKKSKSIAHGSEAIVRGAPGKDAHCQEVSSTQP